MCVRSSFIFSISFLPACQVFANTKQLQKLVGLRVKYMLEVCKEAPLSVPELVLSTSSNTRDMLKSLADSATEGSQVQKLLVAFDALQTASTWVSMWAEALNVETVDQVMAFIAKQSGMSLENITKASNKATDAQNGPKEQPEKAAEKDGGKADTEKEKVEEDKKKLAEEEDGKQPAAAAAAAEAEDPGKKVEVKVEGQKGQEPELQEAPDSSTDSSMTCAQLELYRDEKCIKSKTTATGVHLFEESLDAKQLGVKTFSSSGMMQLQKSLEAALWHIYQQQTQETEHIMINFTAKAKKDSVLATLPLPSSTCLPFMGPVSQNKGSKGLKMCTLFGIEFYIHPCGENLASAEILVPAWHCKSVAKADQAFFTLATKSIPLWVSSSCGEDLTSVSFHVADPTADLPVGHTCLERQCSLQFLMPVPDLEAKLEADLKARRDKAEKSTRAAIASQIKQQQNKEKSAAKAAATKKKGGPRKRKGAPVPEEDDQPAAAENANPNKQEVDLEAAYKKAAEDEKKLESLIAEAVASCKQPTSIPLTRLSSEGEKAANSTRALLMQNILKEKEAQDKDKAKQIAEAESSEPMPGKLGAPAAVQALARDGDGIFQKKKKGKTENTATAATENVMKMGKHVLK